MTDKTKLNRRDAIKVLGAAAGASVLANIPAKWSKPELVGGRIPAFAQTSNCPVGTSAMTVFIQGNGGIDGGAMGSIYTEIGDFATGFTAFFDCQSNCFGFLVVSLDTTDVHVVFTVNGVVVFDQTYNNTGHYVIVNGLTGEFGIDTPPNGCD